MSIYESYQKEIRRIRKSGNTLLRHIKRHETLMNQRKQRMIPATFTDCYKLYTMATRLLRMLAFIDTYKYFQLINMPLIERNMFWFYQIINNNYQNYVRDFKLKISQLQIIDFTEVIQESIDFTIN